MYANGEGVHILGTITLAYLMLKIYKNNAEKGSKNTSDSSKNDEEEVTEKKVDNDLLEVIKPESTKRKLEETEGAMKLFKSRPNFFLGLQVFDVGIHKKVKKLQEQVIAKNPILHPALINVPTLHVTLAVTHLANETDIKTLKEKLDEWATKNTKEFFDKPMVLNFIGIKTFTNVVAYVDIEKNQSYEKLSLLSQSINDLLSSAGFSTDRRSFNPHLTILKLSKDYKLIKMKKRFKKDFETLQLNQEHFGKQKISHIQLLSMDDKKDENGYYKCYHSIKVSDAKMDLDHSVCCSPIPKPKKVM